MNSDSKTGDQLQRFFFQRQRTHSHWLMRVYKSFWSQSIHMQILNTQQIKCNTYSVYAWNANKIHEWRMGLVKSKSIEKMDCAVAQRNPIPHWIGWSKIMRMPLYPEESQTKSGHVWKNNIPWRMCLGGSPTIWLGREGPTGNSQAVRLGKSRVLSRGVRTLSHRSWGSTWVPELRQSDLQAWLRR